MSNTITEKKICSVEGCENPSRARDFCTKHYTRVKKHGDPLIGGKIKYYGCSVEGCARKHLAKGFCKNHYMGIRRNGDPLINGRIKHFGCSVEGCEREHKAFGVCDKHYAKLKTHGDPLGGEPERNYNHGDICEVQGCEQTYQKMGMCGMHYQRMQNYGNPGPAERFRSKPGEGLSADGYIIVTRNGRIMREHRWVMEQMIGRRLTREEEVHHKDRDRTNNSPHNLQLFSCHRDHMKLHHAEGIGGYAKKSKTEDK